MPQFKITFKEDIMMNKYQEIYCNDYYDGKMPRDKVGKIEFSLLGNLKSDRIRVHFEKSDIREYVIKEECNMPNGIIDVETLASNLRFWDFRGFKVEYL